MEIDTSTLLSHVSSKTWSQSCADFLIISPSLPSPLPPSHFSSSFIRPPRRCIPTGADHLWFPKSTCDVSHRTYLSLEKKNRRLWNTRFFQNKVSSFSRFFESLQTLGLLHNHSSILCVSAGSGQEVMALRRMGVEDVTGVELIDSPPLVKRADPHNLPFFDNVFHLAFSAHLDESLFPGRYVAEMERTVRKGGACVVVIEQCGDEEVKEVVELFRNSKFWGAENVTLIGLKMTRIVMKVQAAS